MSGEYLKQWLWKQPCLREFKGYGGGCKKETKLTMQNEMKSINYQMVSNNATLNKITKKLK